MRVPNFSDFIILTMFVFVGNLYDGPIHKHKYILAVTTMMGSVKNGKGHSNDC